MKELTFRTTITAAVNTQLKISRKKWMSPVFYLSGPPPMSRKTSLSQLLEQQLLQNPGIRVFRISVLWMGGLEEHGPLRRNLRNLCISPGKNLFSNAGRYIKTVLIMDEVQI